MTTNFYFYAFFLFGFTWRNDFALADDSPFDGNGVQFFDVFDCTGKPDGNYPDPVDQCSGYFYMCSNQISEYFSCALQGTVFDPTQDRCDFCQNVYPCNADPNNIRCPTIITTVPSRATCPPYDPNLYVCVCGATSCNLQLISTTSVAPPPTCPPYDPNDYICVCGATSCSLELITTTLSPPPTCPPYDPNYYICTCGATSCSLQLITTTMRTTTQGGVVCPLPADIVPCQCAEYSGTAADGIRISLDCSNQLLADSKVSSILDSFLRPEISPLGKVDLTLNRLTTVPDQIRQFPKLDYVSLFNNDILSIQPNAFNFLTTLKWLYLDSNKLATISPGAFQGNGYGDGSKLWLNDNQLTRFESTIFQSVLEKIAPYGGYPLSYLYIENNPIDCVTDYCHMAWLIRDNRQLLSAIRLGYCSNGTAFNQLNPGPYINCP